MSIECSERLYCQSLIWNKVFSKFKSLIPYYFIKSSFILTILTFSKTVIHWKLFDKVVQWQSMKVLLNCKSYKASLLSLLKALAYPPEPAWHC